MILARNVSLDRSLMTNDILGAQPRKKHIFLNRKFNVAGREELL